MFRNQGGRIRFLSVLPMLGNTTSEKLRRLSHVLKPTFTTGNQVDNMLRVATKVRVTDNEVLLAHQRTLESQTSIQFRTQPTPTRGAAVNLARIVAITNGVISQLFEGKHSL